MNNEELKEKFYEKTDLYCDGRDEFGYLTTEKIEGFNLRSGMDGEIDWDRVWEYITTNFISKKEDEEIIKKSKGIMRKAIEWVLWRSNKDNPHLGHPRLSDKNCIFCNMYFALDENNGASGYTVDEQHYENLIEEIKKFN